MSPLRFPKKRPLDRKDHFRSAKLVVIATEGKETEAQYFAVFGPPRLNNPKLQVKVIATDNGKSSPEHVLDRLDRFKEDVSLEDGDELWLMIDLDRWTARMLSRVTQEAEQKGYRFAISNPCFECWLLLHFEDIPEDRITCRTLTKRLKRAMGGYNKSKLNVERFTRQRIEEAIVRARLMDESPNDRWPRKTGTHAYRVVKGILESGRALGP